MKGVMTMANQYTLDNDFAAIAEPQGTLYNVGDSAIELADADTTPKGQGILLMTGERRTFNGTLYARSMDTAATLNVSDFTEAGEGGDVSDVRRPSTEYAAGALVDGAGLASGLVLRCTTAGTTSSAALDCSGYGLGDTITDGTAVWLVVSYAVSTGDAFFIGLDGNWCPSSADTIYSAYFAEGADGNLYPLEGGN